MENVKSNLVTYKDAKSKVEITGETKNVNELIKQEQQQKKERQRFNMFIMLVFVVFLLFKAPQTSWLPFALQWLKSKLPFLIVLLVQVDFLQVLLSG
jgi:cytoskeletal protein RodZ